jgi:hypothetical protein
VDTSASVDVARPLSVEVVVEEAGRAVAVFAVDVFGVRVVVVDCESSSSASAAAAYASSMTPLGMRGPTAEHSSSRDPRARSSDPWSASHRDTAQDTARRRYEPLSADVSQTPGYCQYNDARYAVEEEHATHMSSRSSHRLCWRSSSASTAAGLVATSRVRRPAQTAARTKPPSALSMTPSSDSTRSAMG